MGIGTPNPASTLHINATVAGLTIQDSNSALNTADAFIDVVDMSGESDGEGKPAQNYYPGNDIKIIENELDLWYLGILKKAWAVSWKNSSKLLPIP